MAAKSKRDRPADVEAGGLGDESGLATGADAFGAAGLGAPKENRGFGAGAGTFTISGLGDGAGAGFGAPNEKRGLDAVLGEGLGGCGGQRKAIKDKWGMTGK